VALSTAGHTTSALVFRKSLQRRAIDVSTRRRRRGTGLDLTLRRRPPLRAPTRVPTDAKD